MSIRTRLVATLLLLCVGAGCQGDPGYSMFVENATNERVTVYELGAYPAGDRGFVLNPGEKRTTHWLRPRDERDRQETTVKATDDGGTVVFCRKYTYERAKDNFNWTIRITSGVLECS